MRISLIVAAARNGGIGDDHGMPWRLPADLRRFRRLTLGKPVILGRKTHALIGKPLPGRDNVVLTRSRDPIPGCHVAHAPDEALVLAHRLAAERGADEVMIAGGGEVYRLFLPLAQRVYLTLVDGEVAGTATFPLDEIQWPAWQVVESSASPADADNSHAHRFVVLDRCE